MARSLLASFPSLDPNTKRLTDDTLPVRLSDDSLKSLFNAQVQAAVAQATAGLATLQVDPVHPYLALVTYISGVSPTQPAGNDTFSDTFGDSF